MLPRLGKTAQTCTPREHFSAHPGLCHPDGTVLGDFAAFQKQKFGVLFLPRLFFMYFVIRILFLLSVLK